MTTTDTTTHFYLRACTNGLCGCTLVDLVQLDKGKETTIERDLTRAEARTLASTLRKATCAS